MWAEASGRTDKTAVRTRRQPLLEVPRPQASRRYASLPPPPRPTLGEREKEVGTTSTNADACEPGFVRTEAVRLNGDDVTLGDVA